MKKSKVKIEDAYDCNAMLRYEASGFSHSRCFVPSMTSFALAAFCFLTFEF